MSIEARVIPEHSRTEALSRRFGRHMLTVEGRIYDCMSQFSAAYSGGCWRFFELANGGFYMSPPDEAYDIRIDGNGFHGRMSADAAGITVCLFTVQPAVVRVCNGDLRETLPLASRVRVASRGSLRDLPSDRLNR